MFNPRNFLMFRVHIDHRQGRHLILLPFLADSYSNTQSISHLWFLSNRDGGKRIRVSSGTLRPSMRVFVVLRIMSWPIIGTSTLTSMRQIDYHAFSLALPRRACIACRDSRTQAHPKLRDEEETRGKAVITFGIYWTVNAGPYSKYGSDYDDT